MNWLQDIISKFSAQGLAVVGLAYFRDIGKGGVRTVTVTNRDGEVTTVALNEDYNGYIRAVNNANYRLREAIDCTANLYDVEQDVAIVMWLDRKVNPNGVMVAIQQAVAGNDILNTTFDKQVILNEEGLPENDYIMLKVVVRMVSEYAGSSCPADVCAVYYDPCFEVPNRPEPEPPVDPCDCECTVGGDCCDYSVEGVDVFANCVEFTINHDLVFNELEGGFNFFSFQTVQPFFPNYVFVVNQESNPELGLAPTVEELCDAIEASFDSLGGLYSYQRNGNSFKVCYTGIEAYSVSTIGLEGAYNVEFDPFSYSINSQVVILSNQEYFNLLISFEQNIPDNTFQVLINSEWTGVTDEVIDGVWTRENVCDGTTITDWRIIDAEDNVIDSGNVTANCTGTEETKTICEWIADHEERIKDLEEAQSSGLTCETIQDCSDYQYVKSLAQSAVQPGDLSQVATSGQYSDLSGLPDLTLLQSKAKVISSNQTAVLDEVYTVVASAIFTDPTPSEGKGFTVMVRNGTATVGGIGYSVAGTVIRRIFHSGAWANYAYYTGVIPTAVSQLANDSGFQTSSQVATAISNKFQFLADLTNTSVNTNSTNNVLGSVLIPANTVTNNTVLEIETWINRATGGANPAHRLFINTANSYTGATQIALVGIFNGALTSKGERTFICKTGKIRGFAFTIAAAIDDAANANAVTEASVDWTVDQYILTVANNATGETTKHELTSVKILRP